MSGASRVLTVLICRNETSSREIKECEALANDFMSGGLEHFVDKVVSGESFVNHKRHPGEQKNQNQIESGF